MVLQYKCPDCGADMAFDSTSGMLSCSSCGRKDNIENYPKSTFSSDEEFQQNDEPDIDETFGEFEEFEEKTSTTTYGADEATEYKCNNCGATLITTADTAATSCSYCGAPVILGDRLSGSLAPSKVLPFTISKEQAQEAFKKWCKKGLLAPKGFMNADRVKNITGMYVPFWLFDLNGRGEADALCTKVRTYERGNYIYTETKHYSVHRKVDLNYSKIPVDASEKMDDRLMDKMEPYNYNQLKEFNAPYLAGYIAEKYNYTDKDLFPRVKARTEGYVTTYIRSTITGYSTVNIQNKVIDVRQRNADYTLLPVWMICYDYKQAEHTFAMNGQTGKIVGKPPISIKKAVGWFCGVSTVSFIIIKAIALALGGSLL